jgi:hypothetical protein
MRLIVIIMFVLPLLAWTLLAFAEIIGTMRLIVIILVVLPLLAWTLLAFAEIIEAGGNG